MEENKNGKIVKTTDTDMTIQCRCGAEIVEKIYEGRIFFSVRCQKCGNIMYINSE